VFQQVSVVIQHFNSVLKCEKQKKTRSKENFFKI